MDRLAMIALWFVVHCTYGIVGNTVIEPCKSPQFLELGQTGTLQCTFGEEFLGVLWYHSTDYIKEDPTLQLQNSQKMGFGYTAGEYDVYPNGSLIIKHVTLQHETSFTVIELSSLSEFENTPHFVDVIVTITPSQKYPLIDKCGSDSSTCFVYEEEFGNITCKVHGARPPVSILWKDVSTDDQRNVTTNVFVLPEGNTFTSVAVVNVKNMFRERRVVLLKCQTNGLLDLLETHESRILVQKTDINVNVDRSVPKYIKVNTTMELSCTNTKIQFLIWTKMSFYKANSQIAYALFENKNFTKINVDDYTIGPYGALIVPRTNVNHEGTYICNYGPGFQQNVTSYKVSIYANPSPPYPVVHGCKYGKRCVLYVPSEGSLSCAVIGIRPNVSLEWNVVSNYSKSPISFYENHTSIVEEGGMFNINVTTDYVSSSVHSKITVECVVTGENAGLFNLATEVDLSVENTDGGGKQKRIKLALIVVSIIAILILAIVVYIKRDRMQRTRNLYSTDQEREQLTAEEDKDIFIKELKAKYREICANNNNMFRSEGNITTTDDFVEVGLEILEKEENTNIWRHLDSYKDLLEDIFNDTKANRYVIHGEAGYGKSTLLLKIVDDWCKHEVGKYADIEIIIYFQLRFLKNEPSIYTAIRNYILPKDSTLEETQIKYIMLKAKVLILFDGFDECIKKDKQSFYKEVIYNAKVTAFPVITTTRLYRTLHKYFSSTTVQVKCTGFDDEAKRRYVEKSITKSRADDVMYILGENPVLADICDAPLVFVMFAHLVYEHKNFRFSSVTIVFEKLLKFVFEHAKKNDLDGNKIKTNKISLMAYNRLIVVNEKRMWDQCTVENEIGHEVYKAYVLAGILVEDVLIKDTTAGSTMVRFYHDVFLQWYAAIYFSTQFRQKTIEHINVVQQINPEENTYFYCFACGLNFDLATTIIKHVQTEYKQYTLLCEMEKKHNTTSNTSLGELCSNNVTVQGDAGRFLHRAVLQLLYRANCEEIPVANLQLVNCDVEVRKEYLYIKSGMRLDVLDYVQKIDIRGEDSTELTAVVIKLATLERLKELRIQSSMVPQYLTNVTLSSIRASVAVLWKNSNDSMIYKLNSQTGQWEKQEETNDDSAN